ncbi:MAG: hypothetical protein HZA91_02380 [Verrucomicrobia bacterium]|nr:hypothetical protein [Verrucomicrobiota bacterium]
MKADQHSFLYLRRPPSRRSGQMIVVVACLLVAMLALMGLVTDAGMVQCNRRHAQRAADAAAQAGARWLLGGQSASNVASAISAATYYATQNMILSADVSVEIPPASSAYFNGSNGYIRVRTIRPVNTTFMRLFLRQPTVNVAAFATAGVSRQPVDVTLLCLRPTGKDSLMLSGNGDINVGQGTVIVNSSDPAALSLKGNGSLYAGNVQVHGGWTRGGNGTIIGQVTTGAPVVPDPFESIVEPVITSSSTVLYGDGEIGYTSPDSGGTASKPANKVIGSTTTLRPGIYWGGLMMSSDASVTLLPGRYVMAGGGLTVSGNGNLNGTDVFIYNTRDPYKPNGVGGYGMIKATGNGNLNLKASTASADPYYNGFVFFNDRANSNMIDLSGNGNVTGFSGYVYNKTGLLVIEGNGALGALGGVVYYMEVRGNGGFSATDPTRSPSTPSVRLVE